VNNPPAAAPAADDNASLYCRNIANAAADARYARQAQALTNLEQEIDDRIAKLTAKQAEYESWVKQRQDFLDKADDAVVAIYSQMRPDAAALQIAAMDGDAAAAVLAKLNPRIASAILNEMDPGVAAHLTNVMAGLPPPAKDATAGKPG
jgi:flagellar motility protein MotE (MotC chaperone)